MYLALTDTFSAKWTDAIHEEWMRSVLEKYKDMSRPQVERIRDLMNSHVRDCLVTGFEHLIPTLTLPDPDDRHVLAAAITCKADAIVTFNFKDFPSENLAPFGIVAQHPDEFLVQVLERHAGLFCSAAKKQRDSLKTHRRRSINSLLPWSRIRFR